MNPTASPLVVPVLWENGTTSSAQVKFEIVCDSACSPNDFMVLSPASSSLLTWTRGGSSVQNITLAIPDDDIYEQVESFRIRLQLVELSEEESASRVAGVGTIGSIGEVVVRISGPNDVHSGFVQFEAECFPDCPSTKYTVLDGGIAQVVLQRRNGSDGAASVRVRTLDDTAVANLDYKPLSKVVRWEEGDAKEKVVLVEALAGVSRLGTKRFSLVLTENDGAVLPGPHASTSYVEIAGPSNVRIGDVNFAIPEPLNGVLRDPVDRSFLPFVTRLNSGLGRCPRVVARKPGTIELLLQRNFATFLGTASVSVRAIEATAIAGVDFEPLPVDKTIAWAEGDADAKTLPVTILDPREYYTGTRTFWVEIASVTNVSLGNCHLVEVFLESVGRVPHIVSFDLDVSLGKLSLLVSHSVLAATLDASKIQLQSQKTLQTTTTQVFQLSRQTTTSSGDGTRIVLDISTKDLDALKTMPTIATSATTVFLSVQPGLFDYVLENCIGSVLTACAHGTFDRILPQEALPVNVFTGDTIAPTLLSFTLDMSQRLVKLRFSEPVDRARVRIEAVALSDSAAATNVYQLSSATTRVFRPQPDPLSGALLQDSNKLPADGTYLTLLLGMSDIEALKGVGNGQIGQQRASTFLSMSREFVTDFASPPNAVHSIEDPATALLQVSASNCAPCPANTFLTSSCSDMKDRVCSACTVCPTNSYALAACTALQDTTCYRTHASSQVVAVCRCAHFLTFRVCLCLAPLHPMGWQPAPNAVAVNSRLCNARRRRIECAQHARNARATNTKPHRATMASIGCVALATRAR